MSKITYKVNCPIEVTGRMPEFCKCEGTAVIVITSEENVDLTFSQTDGTYKAIPKDLTKPWKFCYDVICKTVTCPECPDCPDTVEPESACVEGAAICKACFPEDSTFDLTGENLPTDPQPPTVNCALVANPYTVREEYFNGYIVWEMEDCEWKEPIIRNMTDGGSLNPSK